jgi:probable HAF family extracellular repeat protein
MKLLTTPLLPLVLSLTAAQAFAGGETYTFVDLGTLGGPESVAYGLNDSRQVVGWAHIDGCTVQGHPCRRAFLWSDGVMTDLGLLPGDEESFARAINNQGLIVGTSESGVLFGFGTFHGVTWNSGTPVQLPDLGDGQSFAHDVNDAGVIVGHAYDPILSVDRAVTWQGGVINNVGASEPHSRNRAQGISEDGVLAGFGWELLHPGDAVVFDGKWSTIGGLDGPWQVAEAVDVNSSGLVVGFQAFPQGAWHAATWTLGKKGAVDAGVLPGMDYGELYDVNESGLAVGRSYLDDPPVSRAVMWDGAQLTDLNDLLPAGSGAVLFEAREVNEAGDIAGTAVVDGAFRAFLLVHNTQGGPWVDLGHALAGAGGEPVLEGEGSLLGGTQNALQLSNALPGGLSWLVVGVTRIDLPILFGTLVPTPHLIVGANPIDGAGELTLPFTWPTGPPAGSTTYWQAWIPDASGPAGWTASNALSSIVP